MSATLNSRHGRITASAVKANFARRKVVLATRRTVLEQKIVVARIESDVREIVSSEPTKIECDP